MSVCVCVENVWQCIWALGRVCVCVRLPCLENWMSYKYAHHSNCVLHELKCAPWSVQPSSHNSRSDTHATVVRRERQRLPPKSFACFESGCALHIIHIPCDVLLLSFMQCRLANLFSISLYVVGYPLGCVLHTWPDT